MSNLHPLYAVAGHIDHLNKMLLDRVRGGSERIIAGVRNAGCWKWTPLILFAILVVYLFMGTACFWAIEHQPHENGVRKWYMNLAVNRRHFARSISSRIFNDTRNLLIIIDREQTERVQQLLVESLKKYEDRLEMKVPDKKEWTFLNSFNYAYGLLLTLGHGAKTPETSMGQVFAMGYCLLGIPLFYSTLTMGVYTILAPFLQSTVRTLNKRLLVLYAVVLIYLMWCLLLALFLFYQVFDRFWTSVFTAFLSGMTIQIPNYHLISPSALFVLLAACTVSAAIIVMICLLFASVYLVPKEVSPSKKVPLIEEQGRQTPQKFTIIVDEAGDSKLIDQQ